MKTFLVLIPKTTGTHEEALAMSGRTYQSISACMRSGEFGAVGRGDIITDIENFMKDSNNGDYDGGKYWISYINVEEHER